MAAINLYKLHKDPQLAIEHTSHNAYGYNGYQLTATIWCPFRWWLVAASSAVMWLVSCESRIFIYRSVVTLTQRSGLPVVCFGTVVDHLLRSWQRQSQDWWTWTDQHHPATGSNTQHVRQCTPELLFITIIIITRLVCWLEFNGTRNKI